VGFQLLVVAKLIILFAYLVGVDEGLLDSTPDVFRLLVDPQL
jgi:hypothetical protein